MKQAPELEYYSDEQLYHLIGDLFKFEVQTSQIWQLLSYLTQLLLQLSEYVYTDFLNYFNTKHFR